MNPGLLGTEHPQLQPLLSALLPVALPLLIHYSSSGIQATAAGIPKVLHHGKVMMRSGITMEIVVGTWTVNYGRCPNTRGRGKNVKRTNKVRPRDCFSADCETESIIFLLQPLIRSRPFQMTNPYLPHQRRLFVEGAREKRLTAPLPPQILYQLQQHQKYLRLPTTYHLLLYLPYQVIPRLPPQAILLFRLHDAQVGFRACDRLRRRRRLDCRLHVLS